MLREGAPGEVYNVGGGEERENIDVANAIVDQLGADPSLLQHVADRPGHDRRYSLDSSKLRGARLVARRSGSRRGCGRRSTGTATTRAWWEPIKSGEFKAYYERQYARPARRLTQPGSRQVPSQSPPFAGISPLRNGLESARGPLLP